MRIVHIVRDLDAASGGPSRSIPALAAAQAQFSDVDVQVLFEDRGNDLIGFPRTSATFHAVRGSGLSIAVSGLQMPGIFHLHGLWSPILHRAARLASKKNVPYVVSTRGMLAGWALGHKALKKRLAWSLYQRKDLQQSACLLASSRFEQEDISMLLPGKDVEVIPNGCGGPPEGYIAKTVLPEEHGVRWALALGRLHPVKGYAELIEAWSGVRSADWKLAIAGPDEDGFRSVLEQQINRHGLNDNVHLLGLADGDQKWSLLDQCELFLAPSRTENFGMAIAEAMMAGCPVITTKGTPWQELQEHDGGWWIDLDSGSLEAALNEATGTKAEDLAAKGARGRQLIRDKYTWQQVAAQTLDVYKRCLGRSPG